MIMETPDLGPALRELRTERGWTLEEITKHSGVSRSMVSQIERGEANPTFATLWSLTQALGIEISDLTVRAASQLKPEILVATREQIPEMRVEEDDVVLRILSPIDLADIAEWYELSIESGAVLKSAPHAVGTIEHLTILDGTVDVIAGEAHVPVAAGSTARYQADIDHEIRNTGAGRVRALLVVIARSIK